MASRTVNLSEEAYHRLAALKREGESFTDVVNRLTGKYAVLQLRGILTPAQAERLRAAVHVLNARMDEDFRTAARRSQRGRA